MLSVPKLTAKSFAQLRLPEDTRSVVGFGEHPTTGQALLQVCVTMGYLVCLLKLPEHV